MQGLYNYNLETCWAGSWPKRILNPLPIPIPTTITITIPVLSFDLVRSAAKATFLKSTLQIQTCWVCVIFMTELLHHSSSSGDNDTDFEFWNVLIFWLPLGCIFWLLTITVVGVLGMRVFSLGVAGKDLKMQMPVCFLWFVIKLNFVLSKQWDRHATTSTLMVGIPWKRQSQAGKCSFPQLPHSSTHFSLSRELPPPPVNLINSHFLAGRTQRAKA